MPHVGEMVHIDFRGRHMPALITEFYEDEDTARLTVFDQGGPTVHSRVLRGDEDLTFHSFDDCPQLEFVAPEPWSAPKGEDDKTVPELKAELQARGLPVSGNKGELIARLAEAEAEDSVTTEEVPVEEAPTDAPEEEAEEAEEAAEEEAEPEAEEK